MSMTDKKFTWILIIIISVFTYILLLSYKFHTEAKEDLSKKEQELKDSINYLQTRIDSSHIRQASLQKAYDSLLNIEPSIIYKTREKIKFIYLEANATQLDSIIRTKSKRKRRYS
jgi:hypothetical protein